MFAASLNWFDKPTQIKIRSYGISYGLPGFSDNLRSCAVAIVAEVKATSSQPSLLAAKNQWSMMAYTQLMQRVSITREETYVGDENICQYGYVICGLDIRIWKMSLALNCRRERSDKHGARCRKKVKMGSQYCPLHKKE